MQEVDGSLRQSVIEEYEGLVANSSALRDRMIRRDALMAAMKVLERLPISDELEQNLRALDRLFAGTSDWVVRKFAIAGGGPEAAAVYIDGITDKEMLEDHVLKPLMYDAGGTISHATGASVHADVLRHAIVSAQIQTAGTLYELVDSLLQGDAALMIDGDSSAFILGTRTFETRSVSEPDTESVVRGPREGFIEHLRTNTALVRRRIRSSQLKIESITLGRFSQTDVALCYIQGLAPEPIVQEVRRRLARIDIDGILDSATIEELIEDDPYSPFPQVIPTERPDIVAANLLEGRVAIIAEGSPFALIVPISLWSLLQASEDYYDRYYIGTFLRLLRYGLAFLALLGPALYVAITTFHQEMLPSPLLLTLAATREGIPFPSVVEALMMELMFEALREAGVRLPRNVGQAVSIVGALVIGQAAVQAGIVSAPMVIIVAVTGIASFSFPRFNLGITVRLIRFPLMLIASTFGLYGIVLGLLIVLIHLSGLRSFGIPYLAPVVPLVPGDLHDVVVRPPTWLRGPRPRILAYLNPRRQGRRIKPGPAPWERGEGGESP